MTNEFRYEALQFSATEWFVRDTETEIIVGVFDNETDAQKYAISLNIQEELY